MSLDATRRCEIYVWEVYMPRNKATGVRGIYSLNSSTSVLNKPNGLVIVCYLAINLSNDAALRYLYNSTSPTIAASPSPFGGSCTHIMHKQSIACDPEDVLSLDFEVVDGLRCVLWLDAKHRGGTGKRR